MKQNGDERKLLQPYLQQYLNPLPTADTRVTKHIITQMTSITRIVSYDRVSHI